MPSKREQVIDRLFNKLKTLETPNVKVYRNLDKPLKIPAGGIIILRDGVSDEPEVLLSPLTYIYEHVVTAEIIVQHPDPFVGNSMIDTLLMGIGNVINAQRTLDGLAEWVEARTPDFLQEPIEGAPSMRAATLPIMVRFFTSDPLN